MKPNTHTQNSFCLQHAENLTRFNQILAQRRFWYVLPKDESDLEKATAIFDRKTGLLCPAIQKNEIVRFLHYNRFAYLVGTANNQKLATLHIETKLLWNNDTSDEKFSLQESLAIIQKGRWADLDGWALPRLEQLKKFAQDSYNPHRNGKYNRLKTFSGSETSFWLTSEGGTDTDNWNLHLNNSSIFTHNTVWQHKSHIEIFFELMRCEHFLLSPTNTKLIPLIDKRWQELSDDKLLLTMQQEDVELCSIEEIEQSQAIQLRPTQLSVHLSLREIDYIPCRLPKLDQSQMRDPNKGLWELFGEPRDFLIEQGLVARDP